MKLCILVAAVAAVPTTAAVQAQDGGHDFWEADHTHDYINLDADEPYPVSRLLEAPDLPRVVSEGETRNLTTLKLWDLGQLPQERAVLLGEGRLTATLQSDFVTNRCGLSSPYLPRCLEKAPFLDGRGRSWLLLQEVPAESAEATSLSGIFVNKMVELSLKELARAKASWSVSQRRVVWTNGERAEIAHAWREGLTLFRNLVSLAYYVYRQLGRNNLGHCLYSWHSIMLLTDSNRWLEALDGAEQLGNSTFLRHTPFAVDLRNSSCPEFFKGVVHERSVQRHFDKEDAVALLKQVRVHAQLFMAIARSVSQNFKIKAPIRKLYAMYVLTNTSLNKRANESEVGALLEAWNAEIVRLNTVGGNDTRLAELTEKNWTPVYTGRIPAQMLTLHDDQREFVHRLFKNLTLEQFKEPTNGYHSVVGFGKANGGHFTDCCDAQRRMDQDDVKVIVKVPMPTAMTHLNDWLNGWLDEKHLAEKCAIDPRLKSLFAHSFKLKEEYADGDLTFVSFDEFVEGQNLRELLLHTVSGKQAGPVLANVTKQLMPMWTAEYNHNDLALGNIMITPEGRVKLIDAGALRKAEKFADSRYSEHLKELLNELNNPLAAKVPQLPASSDRAWALKQMEKFIADAAAST